MSIKFEVAGLMFDQILLESCSVAHQVLVNKTALQLVELYPLDTLLSLLGLIGYVPLGRVVGTYLLFDFFFFFWL